MYGAGMKMRGNPPAGMMGYGPPCNCPPVMHEELVKRLDLIEARMAKIEAILERLMKRYP